MTFIIRFCSIVSQDFKRWKWVIRKLKTVELEVARIGERYRSVDEVPLRSDREMWSKVSTWRLHQVLLSWHETACLMLAMNVNVHESLMRTCPLHYGFQLLTVPACPINILSPPRTFHNSVIICLSRLFLHVMPIFIFSRILVRSRCTNRCTKTFYNKKGLFLKIIQIY